MKKWTAVFLIALVGIVGLVAGYFIGRMQTAQGHKTMTLLRYTELPYAATVIKRVGPTYPQSALRDRLEGTVRLKVIIGADGSATSPEVVKSVREDLDNAAKEAVTLWKFAPLIEGGKPISGPAIVSMEFRLDSTKSTKH